MNTDNAQNPNEDEKEVVAPETTPEEPTTEPETIEGEPVEEPKEEVAAQE